MISGYVAHAPACPHINNIRQAFWRHFPLKFLSRNGRNQIVHVSFNVFPVSEFYEKNYSRFEKHKYYNKFDNNKNVFDVELLKMIAHSVTANVHVFEW